MLDVSLTVLILYCSCCQFHVGFFDSLDCLDWVLFSLNLRHHLYPQNNSCNAGPCHTCLSIVFPLVRFQWNALSYFLNKVCLFQKRLCGCHSHCLSRYSPGSPLDFSGTLNGTWRKTESSAALLRTNSLNLHHWGIFI